MIKQIFQQILPILVGLKGFQFMKHVPEISLLLTSEFDSIRNNKNRTINRTPIPWLETQQITNKVLTPLIQLIPNECYFGTSLGNR